MRIPKDVILVWPSTNASIPANWLRETSLDDKYPKAWGSQNPNLTGGASSHSHTSPNHQHALNAHTHTYVTGQTDQHDETVVNNVNGTLISARHYHSGTSSSSSGGTTGNTAVTYGTVANDPPFMRVIFIKANYGAILAEGIVALWGGFGGNNNVPTNWQLCNGANGSPDLRNKYLKGASTGGDSGATGGSLTNVHDITHTHTTTSHSHAQVTTPSGDRVGNPNSEYYIGGTGSGGPWLTIFHNHTVTFNDNTEGINQFAGSLTTTETVEPAYKKLVAMMFKSGAIKEKGLIGLWLGAVADIPRGWALCDGNNGTPDMRDKHIKIASDTTEIGNTGGSNTHTHGAQAHAHTGGGHTHTGSVSAHIHNENLWMGYGWYSEGYNGATNNNYDRNAWDWGNHSFGTTGSTTAGYANANTTADSASNEPEYRTAVFIQYQFATDGGFFLENFI